MTRRQGAWILGAALLALGLAVSFQDIRTFDYWWHLRTGAVIAETGSVPKADIYTYTVPGARWIDIHWLHQLGLYGVYSLGGHAGVVVAKGLLVTLLLGLVGAIGWRRERPWVTALGLGLMLLVAGDRLMPRPELSTFVLLAGVLLLLDRHVRRGGWGVTGVALLQLVWVNVHGLFAVGLALVGITTAAEVLRPLIAPGEALRRDRVVPLLAALGLSLLATLANPNGLEGALYPIQQLGMIGPPEERGVFGSLIAELTPPFGGQRALPPLALALLGTLSVASFAAMLANWRRVHPADVLVWVAFAYLALGAQRNLALFAIVVTPIFVRNANEVLDRHPLPAAFRPLATGALAALLLVAAADVARGSFYPRIGSTREPGFGVLDVYYPVGAAEWISAHEPEGPIFHHMADGGYLIWRLYPRYPVMVDGRLEVFGPDRFVELQAAEPMRFRALDEQYDFGVALLHYSLVDMSELLRWLHLNSNWRLAFVDDVAAVFVRQTGSSPPVAELDVDAPDLLPPLTGPPGLRDRIARMARTNFYTALHRFEKALALWEETLERYPDLEQGPILHAALLQKNGFTAAAEAILQRLREERPEDAVLLVQIGDLRLESGDTEAARELYEEALALDPKLPYALYRRGTVAELEGDPQDAIRYYVRAVAGSHPASPLALRAASRLRALGAGVAETTPRPAP